MSHRFIPFLRLLLDLLGVEVPTLDSPSADPECPLLRPDTPTLDEPLVEPGIAWDQCPSFGGVMSTA